MIDLRQNFLRCVIKWELALVLVISWVAFIAIPLCLGEIGISWDALNHHIYLGWTAEHPRFDRDWFAASGQTVQYPYLYWPVYRLSRADIGGQWAGVVLATLYWAAVPPVWLMARYCMPGGGGFGMLMRFIAVALAFMTCVVLSMFDSTSNDLLAAIPFMWGLSLALKPLADGFDGRQRHMVSIAWSGLLAGVSIAFKLSNGPLAMLLPGLWLLAGGTWRKRVSHVLVGCFAILVGFAIAYGYWGGQLWTYFGNPVYPFYDHWFVPLRSLVGWTA